MPEHISTETNLVNVVNGRKLQHFSDVVRKCRSKAEPSQW